MRHEEQQTLASWQFASGFFSHLHYRWIRLLRQPHSRLGKTSASRLFALAVRSVGYFSHLHYLCTHKASLPKHIKHLIMKHIFKLEQLFSLATCILIISSFAILKQGRFWGTDLRQTNTKAQTISNDTLQTLDDGSLVINTTHLAPEASGFGGPVPLKITITDHKVAQVKALPNNETEAFFDRAAVILNKWNGKDIADAASMKVDAVSGATYSSTAIIANVRKGLQYAQQHDASTNSSFSNFSFDFSAKNIAGLLVVLMAAILPLFIKNAKYQLCQMILNVIVLGFWCGEFLSYSSLIGFTANGISITAFIIPAIMIITAFIYPLFGKKSYYCAHVCPFGSLQQVVGKCTKHKTVLSPVTVHRLNAFRQVLWAALMLCIWGGVWSNWTDYEPFQAFIFQSAPRAVIIIAAAFVLLSAVVTRPYCRFVCPMGTLFRISQNEKHQ